MISVDEERAKAQSTTKGGTLGLVCVVKQTSHPITQFERMRKKSAQPW
jgi:hypothetical protein